MFDSFLGGLIKNESMMNDFLLSTSTGETKPNEFDFARAATEVRELREEGSQLRQENIELKVSYNLNFCKRKQI